MIQFRKKPVVIEAVRFPYAEYADNPLTFDAVPEWLELAIKHEVIKPVFKGEDHWYLEICTLEGVMLASPGDWIIRGVADELYPCKPDIFAATYEPVSAEDGAAND